MTGTYSQKSVPGVCLIGCIGLQSFPIPRERYLKRDHLILGRILALHNQESNLAENVCIHAPVSVNGVCASTCTVLHAPLCDQTARPSGKVFGAYKTHLHARSSLIFSSSVALEANSCLMVIALQRQDIGKHRGG